MPFIDTYSGNPLLKRANVNIEFTAEQIQEYIKCSKDPVYFAKNYLKIVSLDEGLIPFKMYKFQEKLIRNFHKHRFNICKLPRQVGKSFKLDTPIPTPNGWTTMGDVKVGDVIFGRDGKHTIVTSKSKIHSIDTYEIEFDTGEILKACSQHRWKVSHSDWNHKEKVLTTKDIIDKFEVLKSVTKPSSIYINAPEAIEMPEADLPIDPYTFGAWLGDGSRSTGDIVGIDEDIKIIASNIPLEIIKTSEVSGNDKCIRYWFKNLNEELQNLNVTEEKFIPDIYLRASVNQRLELLRGLMDTDGCAYPNGACEFYQKDGILLYQVRELISSLGIKTRIRFKKVAGYDGNYGTIRFTTTKFEVFKLPRKLERQKNCKNHPKNTRLYIKDIRQVKPELMQCLSVDNEDHMFLCGRTFIPTHNSTTAISYLIHYIIFNDNANIALLANKAQTAKELLGRLQLAYENLPKWLQHGVKIWNKASLELDNGSKIIASSTSGSAIRGGAYNVIFLDEFAFIPNQIADEFFSSVYPTITSGKSTKVIMVSTPKGMNSFYKFWTDAIRGKNEYVPTEVHWSEVPGRDEKWKAQTIANTSQEQWEQEFECSFLGSVDTLISSSKLQCLVYNDPVTRSEGLDVYENPIRDHNYMITVDVSEGTGKDYHAFVVIDITSIPYKIVAKYRNNELKPMLLPDIIYKVANSYNKAYVLIEIASVGDQIAKDLMFDLEYENMLMCSMRGRSGQLVGQGFSGKTSQLGIKMSKQVKRVGCSNLKTIIEDDKLIVNDFDIISELTTFVSKNNSFEGEVGTNDDLCMTLVIFSWLIVQDYFKEMTNNDVRKRIYEEQKDQIEQDMSPFGFINDGILNEEEEFVEKETGDYWLIADNNNSNPLEVWNLDEYGDVSYMWSYR